MDAAADPVSMLLTSLQNEERAESPFTNQGRRSVTGPGYGIVSKGLLEKFHLPYANGVPPVRRKIRVR